MRLWAALRHALTASLMRDATRQAEDFRARREAERQLDQLRRRIVQIEAQQLHEHTSDAHPTGGPS